jgi:hypothetical protein
VLHLAAQILDEPRLVWPSAVSTVAEERV